MLELGNCDFNRVMAEEEPPKLPDEIRSWWEKLGCLASALVGIHGFQIDGTTYHAYVLVQATDSARAIQG